MLKTIKIIVLLSIFTSIFHRNSSILLQNTSTSKNILRIIDGTPAKHGDIPYQLSFKRKFEGYYSNFCGGVIIGRTKLLSAAHCFATRNNFLTSIFKGKHSLKPLKTIWVVAGSMKNIFLTKPTTDSMIDGQWRQIENLTFPHNYVFPKRDIAILFITKPWEFDNNVNSISYASTFIDYKGEGLISGYGRIGKNLRPSKVLLLGNTLLLSNKICNKKHSNKMENFICSSPLWSDIGKGDSGGPLVCNNTGDPKESGRGILVGIVSGKRGNMPFYTRVSSFYDYIEKNHGNSNNLNIYIILVYFELFCTIL